MSRRFFRPALAAVLLLTVTASNLSGQVIYYHWTGNGGSAVTNPLNWRGLAVPAADLANSRIVFGPRTPGFVSYAEISVNQLRFEGITNSFYLQGGYDTTYLGAGGIVYAPTGAVTSSLADLVALTASQTWDIQGGTFILTGPITDEDGNSETRFNITKTGAGTLFLDTHGTNSWSGGLTLEAGQLAINSNTTYYGGLGAGTLTINGGGLIAQSYYGDEDYVQVYNDIVINNGFLRTTNEAELTLGYSGDGESTITLTADTTIQSTGEALFLSGHVTEEGGARKLTVDSEGAVIVDGPTSWTGGTQVTKGVLIFAGENNAPEFGTIKIDTWGYAGIAVPADQDVATFISQIDPTSQGTIGFDSDPDQSPDTFLGHANLSGFNPDIRLGSATHAIFAGTITPFDHYRFGGGGGWLQVDTALTGERSLFVASPALPLTLRLTSSENSFSAGTVVSNSALIFDADAFGSTPAGPSIAINPGGYVGSESTTLSDLFGRLHAGSTGMFGWDRDPTVLGGRTIEADLDLSGFTSAAGIWLGTASVSSGDGFDLPGLVIASAQIIPQGSAYRFGAYKGGYLRVDTALTNGPENAPRSVYIGDLNSIGTMGDFAAGEYSRVQLSGDSSYSGTTTLYAGELIVGQSNGAIGEVPTTALGTGALVVQPFAFDVPAGHEDVYPQLTLQNGVVLPNAIELNSDLGLGGEGVHLERLHYELAGNISGTGSLNIEAEYTDVVLSGSNTFSGGLYLSGNSNHLFLNSDTAAGTGPLGFGGGSYNHVFFGTSAPIVAGLSTNDYSDYAILFANQPDTVLTIDQPEDALFQGEFRSNDLSDSLRVVKSGPGTLYLAEGGLYVHNGVNVDVDPTAGEDIREVSLQVNAGTVVVGGAFFIEDANPTIWVNGGTLGVADHKAIYNPLLISSGKLAGTGYFPTATIGANTTLSPGLADDPIGRLDFHDLTLGALGTLEFNVRTADPLAGDYDLVTISGDTTLHITAGTTVDNPLTEGYEDDRFTLKLISLQADGTPGTLTGFSGDRSWTWTLFDASSSSIDGFDPAKFRIDTSLFFTDVPGTTFTLSQSGNLLQLTFQPVPEPSTYALMGLGLALVAFEARRRRRQA